MVMSCRVSVVSLATFVCLALASSAVHASCDASQAAVCAQNFAQCTRDNSGKPCNCYQPYADCLCSAECASSVNGVYSACSESVGADQCSPQQCPLPCGRPTPTPTPTTQVCSVTTLKNCHNVLNSCIALKEYEKSPCECYYQEELCLCRVGCTQAAKDVKDKCDHQNQAQHRCGSNFVCVSACNAPPSFLAAEGEVDAVTGKDTESAPHGNGSAPAATSASSLAIVLAVCVCVGAIAGVAAVLNKRRGTVEAPSNAEPLL
eukprot:TRINITY_DN37916_c0_g1_i1.p1 TRINITY_DN37916_c0_g1~~TRINITY_DN37916_c0_g1_i1.p1  ORF type:complete len:261 (+),score=26.03 TRINITY_DN37916_c0_g1_i1:140-922(+)